MTASSLAQIIRQKSRTLHPLRWIHFANSIICLILTALLISTAVDIRSFISSGSEISGFGNYSSFAYPATYVYMLIPAVCALVYSLILFFDPSPSYLAWKPSKILLGSIAFFTAALFLAALLPVLPGADVMTAPDSAMSCTWRDYMSWRVIYNNPDVFPWVGKMDTACQQLRAADAMCWILAFGWASILVSYSQRAKRSPAPSSTTRHGGDGVGFDEKTDISSS